jgi:hypothetical protein
MVAVYMRRSAVMMVPGAPETEASAKGRHIAPDREVCQNSSRGRNLQIESNQWVGLVVTIHKLRT